MGAVIIVQARMGSTRLPGKVLEPLGTATVLDYVFDRCRLSARSRGLVLATTVLPEDDPLEAWARERGYPVFRGSGTDVLDRYLGAAEAAGADPVVRVTGDCPLVDPGIIDAVIDLFSSRPCDYACIEGLPRGVDGAEAISLSSLRDAHARTSVSETYYREHVMTYIAGNPARYRVNIAKAPEGQGAEYRLCVDEPADLELIRRVCDHFLPRRDFPLSEILAYLRAHPEIASLNSHVRQKTH